MSLLENVLDRSAIDHKFDMIIDSLNIDDDNSDEIKNISEDIDEQNIEKDNIDEQKSP